MLESTSGNLALDQDVFIVCFRTVRRYASDDEGGGTEVAWHAQMKYACSALAQDII